MIVPPLRSALSGAALACALVACGGPPPSTSSPAPAATVSAEPTTDVTATRSARADVEAAYSAYNTSLLNRDFSAACSALTEAAARKIPAAIEEKGGPKGLTCVQAFEVIYRVPQAAQQLDAASRDIELRGIDVVGDSATITFATADGRTGTATAIREDGRWLIEGNG
jgi:hypothetical protein